jgi:hypothetical protein
VCESPRTTLDQVEHSLATIRCRLCIVGLLKPARSVWASVKNMNTQGNKRKVRAGDGDGALLAALQQLRLRLLDLTGRNRLLNFRHGTGRSLQFVEGHPAAIYEKLVEGHVRATLNISGLPEPPRRDWVERNGRLVRPEAVTWAREQGIPTTYDLDEQPGRASDATVYALLYMDDLAKHCRKIEREAALAIEETGANMLFLVLGFLDYPDQRDSDRIFSAPLISIPVSLSKRESGGHQVFSLQYTGDDVSENLSLREKLRTDHALIRIAFIALMLQSHRLAMIVVAAWQVTARRSSVRSTRTQLCHFGSTADADPRGRVRCSWQLAVRLIRSHCRR